MNSKIGIIMLLAALVLASGCVDSDPGQINEQNQEAQQDSTVDVEMAARSEINIQIDQISNPAMIRQINQQPVGEVKLKWRSENGETASEKLNLAQRGQVKFVESGLNSPVRSLDITPLRCPDRSFSSE